VIKSRVKKNGRRERIADAELTVRRVYGLGDVGGSLWCTLHLSNSADIRSVHRHFIGSTGKALA
jgi:hypothetical protein